MTFVFWVNGLLGCICLFCCGELRDFVVFGMVWFKRWLCLRDLGLWSVDLRPICGFSGFDLWWFVWLSILGVSLGGDLLWFNFCLVLFHSGWI